MLTGDKSKSRESFIFYDSMLAALLEIGEHEAYEFIIAIKNYRSGLEVKFDQPIKQALWLATFKRQFDRDNKRYEETCKSRQENGRLGGRPRKANGFSENLEKANGFSENQKKAKKADTDSDYDSDSEEKENPLKGAKERFSLTRSKGKSSFVPPTIEEVGAYCWENGYDVDPEQFVDFYQSKGWKIGKSPMKDWQAAVRTWVRRDNAKNEDDETPDVFRRLDAKEQDSGDVDPDEAIRRMQGL